MPLTLTHAVSLARWGPSWDSRLGTTRRPEWESSEWLSAEWGTLGPGGERVYAHAQAAENGRERRGIAAENEGAEDRSSHEGGPRARVNERASERPNVRGCVCMWVGK